MTLRTLAIPFMALMLQLTIGRSHAADAPGPVPVPSGLSTCPPEGTSAADMERTTAMLHGQSLGCFQSSEMIELHGLKKNYAVPLEYAFAVEIKGGPYASKDVDKLMSDVAEGWKNSKPLSQDTRADYEKRLNGLTEKSAPNGTPKPAESVNPPVLVSIEQLGAESFAVVSIRQRQVSLNGEFFNTTKTDAAAVVLKNGRLVRLSIERELRSKSDVSAAREEMADWAYAVAAKWEGSEKPQ
jgi:hypothetical protein